jgi:exopolysaccharide production protein ExoZ
MRKQLNLIQASRALVPLFVLLLHAKAFMHVYFHYDFLNLSNVERSGGVYYFFALSGFMVYYIYKKDLGNHESIKNFLINRAIRIYPLYWILTLIILPVYFILPSLGDGNERDFSHIVASLLLIPDGQQPILSVAWSLGHTMFFYIMFTFAFYKNKVLSLVIPICWGVLSYAFSINVITSTNNLVNFFFNFNNLIFLSGIACAYAITRITLSRYIAGLFIFIGLIGFPLAWVNDQYAYVDIDLHIVTTISSILLILGLSYIDIKKDIKIPRFAKFLGDASFSIYLTHFTSMSAISIILSSTSALHIPNFLTAVLLIIFSIIIGCFVYILLEKPLNKKLKALFLKERYFASKSNMVNTPNNGL